MLEAGEPHGLEVIGPCHIRRIEGGILALGPGCDMWYDTNPYEVGMGYDWMVDLEQLRLHRQGRARQDQAEGPKRQLVGVEIGGERVGSYNDDEMMDMFPVLKDGGRIGRSRPPATRRGSRRTSATRWCPSSTPSWAPIRGRAPRPQTSAVVVPKPFIDPEKETPKQELTAAES